MNWMIVVIIAILVAALIAVSIVWWHYKKQLEREVKRSQKSEQLKSIFLANVSHALRTPLNAIIGFSDVILNEEPGKLDEKQVREMMTHVNKNGRVLLKFVSQLLELSAYEGSMLTFSIIEVNLAELMASYRRETLYDTKPDVTVRLRSNLSPHCKAALDTTLMHQLMMQLLKNAANYTTKGTITIEYGHERNGLRVTITDTGCGIPDKIKDRIFSALDSKDSLTLAEEATGLGLSICKSIIEALHGDININSEKDKGTVATVWFPCRLRDMSKDI